MRKSNRIVSKPRQRGQVLILVALTLLVLIGAVGLAIDSGRAYGVKARLNAAVDAAAIAGARALATGADDAARIANAQTTAARFFWMNYPTGFLSSRPSTPVTSATRDANGRWLVSVSATAEMPTTFIRVLGHTDVDVAAHAEVVRRDLDAILAMDTSGSLAPPTSSATTFPTLRAAAISGFINKFNPAAGGDRVGLVSFASGAVIDVPINKNADRGFDRNTIESRINLLPVGGFTASAEGLRRAVDELNQVPAALRSSLRVVLLFSDGAPNIVNGTFHTAAGTTVTGNLHSELTAGAAPNRLYREDRRDTAMNSAVIPTLPNTGSGSVPLASFDGRRTLTGSPYDNTRCNVNKASRNMVERIANEARSQDIRIYTIGLGHRLNTLEIGVCGYTTANESGATILKRLANAADSDTLNTAQPQGLFCHAATESDLQRCFSTIASEILRLSL